MYRVMCRISGLELFEWIICRDLLYWLLCLRCFIDVWNNMMMFYNQPMWEVLLSCVLLGWLGLAYRDAHLT